MERGIRVKGIQAKSKSGLEPCPFCGNEPVLIKYKDGVFVKCTVCECMIAKQISVITEEILPFDTAEDAVRAWSTRKSKSKSWRSSKADSPEAIIIRRNARADAIAEVIRAGLGDMVYIPEIMEETEMSKATVTNSMNFTKSKYPQIKSKKGKSGYFWEEIENE